MTNVPITRATLHYAIQGRHGTTRVYMQPASDGTGVIAGGGMRAVFAREDVAEAHRACAAEAEAADFNPLIEPTPEGSDP